MQPRHPICGGAPDPEIDFPERTPQEGAALQEQIDLLRQARDIIGRQMTEMDMLGPSLFGEAGYTAQQAAMNKQTKAQLAQMTAERNAIAERMKGLAPDDPERKRLEDEYAAADARVQGFAKEMGRITGLSKKDDPNATLRQQIESGWLDRVLAAQRGDLPVNPALLRDLREQDQVLQEKLRRDLGPGWATSTPGMEKLIRFGESANIQKDYARRQDMTMAEALSMGRKQESEALRDNSLRRLLGISQRNMPGIGATLQTSAGYQAPLAYMLGERQGQFGADAIQFQYDADNPFTGRNLFRSFQSDARTFGGMGMAMSTIRSKKDVVPLEKDEYRKALTRLRETPITRWRYKHEPDDREKHIGPILELSPKEIQADDTHISLLDYIGLTHAGLKGLDREVSTLRTLVEAKR